MSWEPELEEQFLRLLREADPGTPNQVDIAQEFARRLANFAEIWATDYDIVNEYEQRLADWIHSIKFRSGAAEGTFTAYKQHIERARAEE